MWWILLLACKPDQNLDLIREVPKVGIVSPDDGALLVQDLGEIALEGLVSDLPDAASSLGILWAVDGAPLASPPASGDGIAVSALDLMTLIPGTYTISLSATDSEANTSTAQIEIEVVAPASPPLVEITAPADGSTYGTADAITFTGEASDPNDAADDLTLSWSSSLDGLIDGATSGGGLSFVTTTLTDGEHTIVLSATDLDGEVGTDSIVVIVGDPIDPPTEDPEPGEVIFSELMVNPGAVEDEVGEWVELYNTGGRNLDIGGYSFHDLDFDQFTLTGSIPVAPYSYVVLCASLEPTLNGGVVKCDGWFERLTSGGLALANVPDEVVLSRADGTEIDRLVYASDWVAEGAAIGLDPGSLDGVANDDFANWCFQTTALSGGDLGTPGAVNDTCP